MPDAVLLARVREIVRGNATTEAELRKLRDQADALARVLQVQIEASERRIRRSNRTPGAPIAEVASELRRAADLRPQLEELLSLTSQLDDRARELRSSWIGRG
jgi:hypothetical protein